MKKFDKYDRVFHGHKIDVYDIIKIYNVTDPALQHLLKKVLCAGKRGIKDIREDLENIVASGKRAIEIHLAELDGVYSNEKPFEISIGYDGKYDNTQIVCNKNIEVTGTSIQHVFRFEEKSSKRVWHDFEDEASLFSGRAYVTEEDAKNALDDYIKHLEHEAKQPNPIVPMYGSIRKDKGRSL